MRRINFNETQKFEYSDFYIRDDKLNVGVEGIAKLIGWYEPVVIGNSVDNSYPGDGDSKVEFEYKYKVYDMNGNEVNVPLSNVEECLLEEKLQEFCEQLF